MADITPPISPSLPAPHPDNHPEPTSGHLPFPPSGAGQGGGEGFSSFRKFLGAQGYAQFEQILCNMLSSQIQKEVQKIKQASQRLRNSETGQDD